jgi:hypothetical protein
MRVDRIGELAAAPAPNRIDHVMDSSHRRAPVSALGG